MPRLHLLSTCLLAFAVLGPAPSRAQVGQERPPVYVPTEAFGHLTSTTGPNFIGADETLTLGYGVYVVSTGARVATFLEPIQLPEATRLVVNFDVGIPNEQVLGLYETDTVPYQTTISLQAISGGKMTHVFPDLVLNDRSVRFAGTMKLNSGNPEALVFIGRSGVYIVLLDGTLVYDSTQDSGFPPVLGGVMSVFVDDYDGDRNDELDVVYDPQTPGDIPWSALIGDMTPALGVGDGTLGARARLLPSRPNPVSGSARIAFETTKPAFVRLQVYDAAGRLVNRLAAGPMAAGLHERLWDGRDASGRRLPGGIYFYELVVDGVKETRKLVQLR